MATIKSFTSLEQSHKLAEILPLESADMRFCFSHTLGGRTTGHYPMIGREPSMGTIPCWSLVALLGVLPTITKDKDTANPFIAKTPDNEYYVVYATLTKEVDSSDIYDNPVDACYEMILKLNELNLL